MLLYQEFCVTDHLKQKSRQTAWCILPNGNGQNVNTSLSCLFFFFVFLTAKLRLKHPFVVCDSASIPADVLDHVLYLNSNNSWRPHLSHRISLNYFFSKQLLIQKPTNTPAAPLSEGKWICIHRGVSENQCSQQREWIRGWACTFSWTPPNSLSLLPRCSLAAPLLSSPSRGHSELNSWLSTHWLVQTH